MPRTRSLAWSELKIGLLTLMAVAVAGAVIFLLSGEGGFFWQRYELQCEVQRRRDAEGRRAGARGRRRRGRRQRHGVQRRRGRGDASICPRRCSRASPTSPIAYIGSVSLLGEGALDITPAMGGTPIPDGGYVKTKRTPGQLADVAESATQGLKEATLLIKDIREGKGTVGKLFTDDQLYREIQGFVDAAETVATNLEKGRGTAGKLLTDDEIYDELEGSLVNLRTLDRQAQSRRGQPRQADAGPGLGRLGDLHGQEPRHPDGAAEQGRGHRRQAPDRRRAVQADRRADRRASTR